jgi:hypothetical protein
VIIYFASVAVAVVLIVHAVVIVAQEYLTRPILLDSAEFDPSITQPFVLNPNGYRGECIGR